MADRFDIDAFSRDPKQVARLVRADDAFSFMNRQVSVPASCVAVVWSASGQPAAVSTGSTIQAEGATELLFVRTVPFTLDYKVDGLRSEDDYPFTASVGLTVQVVTDRADLVALRKALVGSGGEVNVSHLHRHCEEAVRSALSEFVSARAAEEMTTATTWTEFDPVLAEHFKPVGFSSGLALGPDPRVMFESPAYAESRQADTSAALQRKRLDAADQMRERSVQARSKHLAELGDLLDQLKCMASDHPGAAMAELVKTFDVSQRGALYEGLAALQQPSRRTEAILAVAGDELLRFDPAILERPTHRQDLASEIGALRSVRLGRQGEQTVILVGARRGVHRIDSVEGPPQTYTFNTQAELRGGVNSALIVGDSLYATHSEVGLARWNLSQPDTHEACLAEVTEGARAVRDLQADETGRLWLSVDNILVGWRPGERTPSTLLSAPVMITAVCVAEGVAYAGLEDGGLVSWDTADPTEMNVHRGATGSAVRSLDWLSGGGVPRLLIADKRPHLELMVVGDAFLSEYRCGHKLRWGVAAEDCIVGVNDRRDQLFTWRLDQPQIPNAGISIGRLCGRSIQDVALLPAHESA